MIKGKAKWEPVTILIPIEEFTLDILKSKMEKYLALGYEVKLINYN
jgi:hypothetical protein